MSADVEVAPVLVTGGSGYLAGFVIMQLLAAGRGVHTTIRDLARADAVRATLGRHALTGRLPPSPTCTKSRPGSQRCT